MDETTYWLRVEHQAGPEVLREDSGLNLHDLLQRIQIALSEGRVITVGVD